jgi:phosphatidylglycerol:prolipoprotein diacylglycerol transferase
MLIYPDLDPVAFSLGELSVRWYGVMYMLAFLCAWGLAFWRGRKNWDASVMDDLLFLAFLGIIIGGRLGQVVFYDPGYYFDYPQEIFKVWKGGMSFHGGFLGVVLAVWWWARKYGKTWREAADFAAPLAPLGLMFGRLGNFINGEIWGRVADPTLPWAMVFPHVDMQPRHPAQLYHASLEGLVLFLILWVYSGKKRPEGAVTGVFLIGYGIFRSFVEFFREPDHGIFGQSYTVSMGQWLSLPMIILGIFLLWTAYRGKKPDGKPSV